MGPRSISRSAISRLYDSPVPAGSAQGDNRTKEFGKYVPSSLSFSKVINAKFPPAESPPIVICSDE